MVRPERLELPTLCSEGRCSIQLSYGRLGLFYGKIGFVTLRLRWLKPLPAGFSYSHPAGAPRAVVART
jgi:hypothetical protein